MQKIAVITDAHANLPALQSVLQDIGQQGCDAIFHTGDAIAIGPFPSESMDLLLNTPDLHFVMGNHDAYFVDGLPWPQPGWMSDGEVTHQLWTHAQLDPQLRAVIAQWPYRIEREFQGVKTAFMHYALTPSGHDFVPLMRHPVAVDLDRLFEECQTRLVFYGHAHRSSDLQGAARYVDPGSLGCHTQAIARYALVEFQDGRYRLEHRSVPYNDAPLLAAFETRHVPEREFIYRAFFGGRF